MQVQLKVDGYFNIDFFYLNGKQVGIHKDEDILQGVLDNLQMGEYVIGFETNKVFDINDLSIPLYSFELNVTDDVEYDFDVVE